MQELTTWVYFFPVRIRARYLLIFLTLLSLFGTLVPFDSVAHAAHLGGIIVGISFVRWGETIADSLSRWWPPNKMARHPPSLRDESPGPKAASGTEEFISKEVDPILEKISKQGIQSLTAAERNILEAARKKMEKR